MTQLPIDQSIPRFAANEERVDIFVNDPLNAGKYTTNETTPREVETLPHLVDRIAARHLQVVYEGDWVVSTAYSVNDLVKESSVVYICIEAHTSGVFTTDFSSGKWKVFQANDASEINYTVPFTGAVPRTQHDKNQERISVLDFGADPTGATFTNDAIQLAINYVLTKGGELYFPAGTYKINAPLLVYNSTNDNKPMIRFIGDGIDSTKIKSYITNGPIFDIRGTKKLSDGGIGSKYFRDGCIIGLFLDGHNCTGTSDAITIQGWQYGNIKNCWIEGFPRDGIRQWVDAGYNNPDVSSSSINIEDTWVYDCVENGVNQTGPVGAWSWAFKKVLFANCGNGAVITSAGCSFIDCSFGSNGYATDKTVRAGGYHLRIGNSYGGTNRITIKGCEFDFSRLGHISLDYCQTILIEQSRFIFNDRYSSGVLTPSVGAVIIASAGAGSNIQSVRIKDCNIRIDTTGTCNAFVLSNVANVSDITISGSVFSNNSGATLNKYVGFTKSNFNQRYNYNIEENGVTSHHIPGKPTYEYLGACSSATVPNAGVIIFGTQDSANNQIFGSSLYDITNGIFTCPVTGYYQIDMILSVIGATTSEYYQILPRVNSSVATEWQFAGNSLPKTMMTGRWKVFCTEGQTIDIYNSGASGKNISGSYSQLSIKLLK